MKANHHLTTGIFLSIALCSLFIVSCKKAAIGDLKMAELSALKSLDTISYLWGDQSLSRFNTTDIIKYNSAGKIDSVITTYPGLKFVSSIRFTYQGNKIMLNTPYNDTYTLDNLGRVVSHSTLVTNPGGDNNENDEQYIYDGNGYLSKVILSGAIFVNSQRIGFKYGIINYTVQNGNYINYTLSDTVGNNVTRKYDFLYSNTKASSSFSFFSPVFSNNTYSSIEKYLNFGKQSVNLLSAINYQVANEDKTVQTGTLMVTGELDVLGNIVKLNLIGGNISGMPLDNLSPIPRSVSIAYNK
jgi:hypothetical protein